MRTVCFRKNTRPCPDNWGTIEDVRVARDWCLGGVEDCVDDSDAFITQQLRGLGLSQDMIESVRESIKNGLLIPWTRWVLALLSRPDIDNPELLQHADIAAFMKRKFGVLEPAPAKAVSRSHRLRRRVE